MSAGAAIIVLVMAGLAVWAIVEARRPAQPHPVTVEAGPPPAVSDNVILVTYLLAALMPVVGAIVAIVVMAKGRMAAGIGALILAAVAFSVWLSILGG